MHPIGVGDEAHHRDAWVFAQDGGHADCVARGTAGEGEQHRIGGLLAEISSHLVQRRSVYSAIEPFAGGIDGAAFGRREDGCHGHRCRVARWAGWCGRLGHGDHRCAEDRVLQAAATSVVTSRRGHDADRCVVLKASRAGGLLLCGGARVVRMRCRHAPGGSTFTVVMCVGRMIARRVRKDVCSRKVRAP